MNWGWWYFKLFPKLFIFILAPRNRAYVMNLEYTLEYTNQHVCRSKKRRKKRNMWNPHKYRKNNHRHSTNTGKGSQDWSLEPGTWRFFWTTVPPLMLLRLLTGFIVSDHSMWDFLSLSSIFSLSTRHDHIQYNQQPYS